MEQTIKILHVSGAPGWRGGEQQLAYLLEGLLPGTVQFLLLPAAAPLGDVAVKLNIPVYYFSKRSGLAISGALAIKKILATESIDLVHLHDPYAHMAFVVASSLYNIKVPAVLHRRVDFRTGNHALSRWKYNHPNIRRVICVSHAIRDILYPVIERKETLVVVHSGIDLAKYTEVATKEPTLRNVFNLPNNALIIGDVAALEDHKDLFTFIKVAEFLTKSNNLAYFIVAGDGSLRQELIKYTIQAGLGKRVFFPGFIADVPSFLHQLDIFLHTASEEGLGTSIIEAMAAGVPVVATSAGGIPELLDDQINGLLAPVGDVRQLVSHCNSLLNNPSLISMMTIAGKKKSTFFSKEQMSTEMLKLYKDVIHG